MLKQKAVDIIANKQMLSESICIGSKSRGAQLLLKMRPQFCFGLSNFRESTEHVP